MQSQELSPQTGEKFMYAASSNEIIKRDDPIIIYKPDSYRDQ